MNKKTLLNGLFLLLCMIAGGVNSAWAETVTITFSDKYSANTVLTDTNISIDDYTTISFAKNTGSTAPQYYVNGAAVRAYAGNTITVSSSKTIAKIEFVFGASDGSNAITADRGTFSSPTWTGSADEVVFTIGGTSGQRRIASVTIVYDADTGGTDSDDPTTNEVTIDFSTQGYANQQVIGTVPLDGFNITFAKGSNSNAPAYYNTGTAIRAYGGNTMTVTSNSSTKIITKIVLGFGSGDGSNAITATPGTFTSSTWTGSADEVVFTIGGSSGHRRIQTLTITYADNDSEEPDEKQTPKFPNFEDQTIKYGETYTIAAEQINGGPISVKSDNDDIATVDGYVITAKAVGTTTITVATAEDRTYEAGSATFVLTVTDVEGGTDVYVGEATGTLNFSGNEFGLPVGSSKPTAGESYTDGTYTIALDNAYYNTSKYMMLSKGGSLTFQAFDKPVTKIEVVGRSGASGSTKENIYVNDVAVSTEITGSEETNTFNISKDYQAPGTIYTLKVSAANAQITSINIYFVDASRPLTVELSATGYASYCSQYPLDFSGNDGSVYRAWYVSDVNGETVTFTEIKGAIKSGTPIILYGTPNATCEIASVENSYELEGNMLKGTLSPTYVKTEEGKYTNFGLSGGSFVKINTGVVPANKAYLPIETGIAAGARLNIVFEDETTGIVDRKQETANDGRYYNLNGQRVNPTKGGLYIVNGKKVVIK